MQRYRCIDVCWNQNNQTSATRKYYFRTEIADSKASAHISKRRTSRLVCSPIYIFSRTNLQNTHRIFIHLFVHPPNFTFSEAPKESVTWMRSVPSPTPRGRRKVDGRLMIRRISRISSAISSSISGISPAISPTISCTIMCTISTTAIS